MPDVLPEYKCVMGFGYDGFGWEEEYVSRGTSKPILATQLNALIARRLAILPSICTCQGVRVSNCHIYPQIGTPRESQMFYPTGGVMDDTDQTINIDRNGGLSAPTAGDLPAQARVCLLMRLGFDGNRQTIRYLGGIPAYVCGPDPGGMNAFGNTAFGQGLDAFATRLTAGFWQVRTTLIAGTSPQYSIAGIRLDGATPPNLMFDVWLKNQAPPASGDQLHMQFFRPPKGTRLPTVNGKWMCKAWNAGSGGGDGSITVYGSEGLIPSQIRFSPKSFIRNVKVGFTQILRYTPHKVGTHKRGHVPFVPRGRRLARPTLDP